MYCKNCGSQLNENAAVCLNCGVMAGDGKRFCANCGAEPDPLAVICVKCGRELRAIPKKPQQPVARPVAASNNNFTREEPAVYQGGFGGAISYCFKNYANFKGRASKEQFWYFYLFTILVGMVPILGWIASFGLIVPSLACGVRRLQDAGRPWSYIFMGMIPFAGAIILIIAWCKPSEPDNEYGPRPLR